MATIRTGSLTHYSEPKGTVYLLHIEPRYKHAGHYVGFTTRAVDDRFAEHLAGNGSSLTRAALAAGCKITIARVWTDKPQWIEFQIKAQGNSPKLCPICNPRRAYDHLRGYGSDPDLDHRLASLNEEPAQDRIQ